VHRVALVVAAVAVSLSHAFAQPVDSNRARNLAATCTSCHGTNGVSQGLIASLAGVSKADLVNKLQDFKTGRTQGTVMPQLAKGYTDEQIDLIAGWFATQKAPQ
jgi:cytochrome subunit of sulfide dehydrogenase